MRCSISASMMRFRAEAVGMTPVTPLDRRTILRLAALAALAPGGAVPDTILRHYLQSVAKIDLGDVEILAMGEDEVQARLLAGTVDAGSIVEPILTTVLARDPSARILASPNRMMPMHPGAVVLVT